MPDGSVRSFEGFKLMWKALDFLVVCGRWSRLELTDIAQRMLQAGECAVSGVLPEAHHKPGPVSALELQMLQGPRLDPALIRPITTKERGTGLSLDDCLHNAVSSLYRELQERLG